MTHNHLPRPLFILLFILVAVTFIYGVLHLLIPVRAGSINTATSTPISTSIYTDTSTGSPIASTTPSVGILDAIPNPTSTDQAESLESPALTPTPKPTPEPIYVADMTGVNSLGIVMVAVVLLGIILGGRRPPRKKDPATKS